MGIEIEKDTMDFTKMFKNKDIAKRLENVERVIVSGMGGSGISGDIAASLSNSDLQIISWKNYNLPDWTQKKDYVICISYSGNTEETLSAAKKAIELGCRLDAITTGGILEKIVENYGGTVTKIEKGHQPRAALPLLLKPLLEKIGPNNLTEQIKEVTLLDIERKKAKEIAKEIKGKIPCIYAAGIMESIAYRWRCQIEENSKQIALHHVFPEMNHNEIVGWSNNNKNLAVVILRDIEENDYIESRFEITKKLAWKNSNVIEIVAKGKYPLTRMMSNAILGDLVSIELAKLNNVDPTPVDIIENLKEELGRK